MRIFLLLALLTGTLHGLRAQTVKASDHTLNAGKVEWLKRQVQLDNIPYGVAQKAEFPFRNISSEPMMITWVQTSCNCTASDWPKEPVAPGQTGVITVEYDALKEGQFFKIVSVITSFDPDKGVPLIISGNVIKQE
jgi:hypothetical protein